MENQQALQPDAAAPQKFSRYRSVRKAATAPAVCQENTQIKRQPSRYRRAASKPTNDLPPPPPAPPPSVLPQSPSRANVQQKKLVLDYRDPSVPIQEDAIAKVSKQRNTPATRPRAHTATNTNPDHAMHAQQAPHRPEPKSPRSGSSSTRVPTASESYDAAREEARMILEGEFDRMQKMKQQQAPASQAPTMKRGNTTKTSKNRSQKPRALEIPPMPVREVEAKPHTETSPIVSPNHRSKRNVISGPGDGPPQRYQAAHPSSQAQDFKEKAAEVLEAEKPHLGHTHVLKSSIPAPIQHDTPLSAVNAGDRRVEVRCNSASITLPVTPTTIVRDLLNSASVVMSEKIDPKTAVMMEAFTQLGLERPLRRYEKVRDVMNSWDCDGQNALVIMAYAECAALSGLELANVPSSRPLSTELQMQVSSRPGHWEKRWVKLKDDGQVTISKHENGADKECTNICHLSDFDIYTPSRKQTRKVKAPKKICFAVKSQQKSAVFLEGQNFAHFFCTNHRDVADRWYQALHKWRSWYLMNVLGEGGQRKIPQSKLSVEVRRPGTSQSTETVPYQLGSFRPLLNFSELRMHTGNGGEYEGVGRRSLDIKPSSPKRGPKGGGHPSPLPQRFALVSTESDAVDEGGPFTGKGLISRSGTTKTRGGLGTGRGVTGPKGKPLVDLNPQSEFADGSLLRKLEVWTVQTGDTDLKIDRQKRVEVDMKVGEGL